MLQSPAQKQQPTMPLLLDQMNSESLQFIEEEAKQSNPDMFILSQKVNISSQQLEAVKQQHEEMRQQCQRILGNPYYMEELKNQIRIVENQTKTEQVIKGKLTYLNQMFKQIDMQEQQASRQTRKAEQQAEIDQILEEIGETSGKSDYLFLEFQALQDRVASITTQHAALEQELASLTSQAKLLDIHAVIPEEVLLRKVQIAKLQTDLQKLAVDRDSVRTLFEIRMNKHRHDDLSLRKRILDCQKEVALKMRVNEN